MYMSYNCQYLLFNLLCIFSYIVYVIYGISYVVIGYEPAGLTVHPPPQNDRGWVHFFRVGV